MPRLEIGTRIVGDDAPLFIIAELGLNHGGSIARALAMVDAAAAAGASAVKLQSFNANDLVAAGCPAPAHVAEPSLREFFRRFELDEEEHAAVAARARANGLAFLATPFSLSSVEMLERVGVDAIKIASGDLTFDALIEGAAATGKPVLLSTGMSSLDETAHAVAIVRAAGNRSVALLHCVSSYPVPAGSENLRAISTLAREFGTVVGLSDHASDTASVPVAVALGAAIYERHLMMPGDDGVDADVSSSPDELAGVVAIAQRTQAALGHGRRVCLPAEAGNIVASRRSLHATRALPTGHKVSDGDFEALRPWKGLAPSLAGTLAGAVLVRSVAAGAPFVQADLDRTGSRREVA